MTDVVERIDELAAEETCPHCGREYHQLPITQKMVAAITSGKLDSAYLSASDKSPVVCEGSAFIGPQRLEVPDWLPPNLFAGLTAGLSGFFSDLTGLFGLNGSLGFPFDFMESLVGTLLGTAPADALKWLDEFNTFAQQVAEDHDCDTIEELFEVMKQKEIE